MSGRRLWFPGIARGRAGGRVAEYARGNGVYSEVPDRPPLPPPGYAAGRAAGDTDDPRERQGLGARFGAYWDSRILSGGAPGFNSGYALRFRESGGRRSD